jgi:NAD(P)-dependent dehydrogenase (short-subunit alcohol dehydrogenase family)
LSPQNLQIHRLEVTAEDSVGSLATFLEGTAIDILINNAGIKGGAQQGVTTMDYASWTETFAVNTMAPLRVAGAFLPNLRLSSRPRIITISSQMGSMHRNSSGSYAYRSSKAAVNKVMQILAHDLASDGIVVCPVHPGWVRTDMGGPQAELSVEESVSAMIRLIAELTASHSGRFLMWNGEEHPW